MTQIEKTNAKISQKYAARYAADARANLFRLIEMPNGYSSYRLECLARDAQQRSSLFAASARLLITA